MIHQARSAHIITQIALFHTSAAMWEVSQGTLQISQCAYIGL